jgi:hypothetical protein
VSKVTIIKNAFWHKYYETLRKLKIVKMFYEIVTRHREIGTVTLSRDGAPNVKQKENSIF